MFSSNFATVMLLLLGLFDNIHQMQSQQPTTSKEPCIFKESDLGSKCEPCSRDMWLDMVKPSSGSEEITNAEKSCFNDDPITLNHGNSEPVPDGSTVMAIGEYKVSASHNPQGFMTRKTPFLRLAYLDLPSASTSAKDSEYFDLNNVTDYYVRNTSTGDMNHVDLQLFEWPGANAESMDRFLNPSDDINCQSNPDPNCNKMPRKKWMLNFERDNGKILHYPCNAEDGTSIVAVGSISLSEGNLDKSKAANQKMWLAYGNQSLFDNYVQPLYVPQNVLEKMAAQDGSSCSKDEPDLWDLRTVMDFTFTKRRLVLGMKCGILIVGKLASNNITFKVASLQSETGLGPEFKEPINRVSATTCCLSLVLCSKDGGLVAAYSFNSSRKVGDDKFIYVSFDYGDTFEKKIVASFYSPINLIAGLFKVYDKWYDYYELLHNPDDDDLQDDRKDTKIRGFLKSMRSNSAWHTSTTEEKEKMFAIGVPTGKKKKATLQKIVQLLEHRVPKRRERRKRKGHADSNAVPNQVKEILYQMRKRKGWNDSWTDDTCDKEPECLKKFENDRAVDWLLSDGDIHVKTPKRDENEPFCKEITSILLIPEERHIMALCQVGYEKVASTDAGGNNGSESTDFGHFALYNFPIKKNIPLIHGYRVSQRIFTCKYVKNTMDGANIFVVQPEVVRIQGTATIFVINCDAGIYYSTNFGNTLYNAAFFFQQEKIDEWCSKIPGGYTKPSVANTPTPACEDEMTPSSVSPLYIRAYQLCALNIPPVFLTDAYGYILITFGKFYAYGAIAYNKEIRLVVGEAIREMDYNRRFENLIFPAIDKNGDTTLTVSLTHIYSFPASKFKSVYKQAHSLRLVRMPMSYNRDSRNYDYRNLGMCKQAKTFGFRLCKTSTYTIYPKRLDMDIGDQQYVQVEVKEDDPFLPLSIFSSNEDSVEVRAFPSLREGSSIPAHNVHNWNVEIKAKPNQKGYEESFVDSFFGADYNKLKDYSTQISFANRPSARCHVQPSSTINVQIGCKGKRLIAHEGRYRPQCKVFRNNFNYTLKKGRYDPDLANLWFATSGKYAPTFFKITKDGDLVVTYDYVHWGCPLEPFAADHFIPDLRVVEENSENDTMSMSQFRGKFIMLELFGAEGFSYSKKVKDMPCRQSPQYLREQVNHWKQRIRLFALASDRLKFPTTEAELKNINYAEAIRGNKLLQNDAIRQHINIWNRANYVPCQEEDKAGVPDAVLNRQYEIMKTRKYEPDEEDVEEEEPDNELETEELEQAKDKLDDLEDDSLNQIIWSRDHPRVFLFLVVAVDEYDSLCDYQTVFGVSLKTTPDMNDLYSFLIFLFFLIFWILLVVGGYHVRKRYLRVTFMEQAKNERLEQAAWSIIYRYEKLIHGNAMDALFHTVPDNDHDPASSKMNLAAKNAHDKRRAELRMKKTHIMAQEQARHERLQKLFQKL